MKSKIKTIADAFKLLKLKQVKLSDFEFLPESIRKYMFNHYNLTVVVRALNFEANGNKEWEPDWNDRSQWKYYPWPTVEASANKPSGFSFSYSNDLYSSSGASVGARLLFLSSELALYALEQFEELYLENQLIIK